MGDHRGGPSAVYSFACRALDCRHTHFVRHAATRTPSDMQPHVHQVTLTCAGTQRVPCCIVRVARSRVNVTSCFISRSAVHARTYKQLTSYAPVVVARSTRSPTAHVCLCYKRHATSTARFEHTHTHTHAHALNSKPIEARCCTTSVQK